MECRRISAWMMNKSKSKSQEACPSDVEMKDWPLSVLPS